MIDDQQIERNKLAATRGWPADPPPPPPPPPSPQPHGGGGGRVGAVCC